MKRTIISVAVIILIVLAGLYAVNSNKTVKSTEKIKIGIITPQTGNLAFLGENVIKSAKLSAEKLGRTNDIEFIIEDVGNLDGAGKAAVSATQKLINVDHVQFIIDGMPSNGTMASAPIVNEARVVMVTPLTGGENIDNAREYVFRNGPSDILGGTQPASDFVNKFGYKKVALLTDNAEYTLDIVRHFKKSFTGTIVSDQNITPDANDYKVELLKLKASNPDAIFLNTATGVSARYVIKQARDLGISVPIFTNFLAFGPDLMKVAGSATEGVYVYIPEVDHKSTKVNDLLAEYKAKYGMDSPIPFHTTGTYDALAMGLEAIDAKGNDGQKIHDYLLKNIQNWSGYNGVVSFDKNGNSGTGFTLMQIKSGNLEIVK